MSPPASLPAAATAPKRRFSFPLYLQLWLAVVIAVAVVTLAFALLWRANAEQAPMRQIIISNEAGEVLGQSLVRPVRIPGQGVEFTVPLKDGSALLVQIPPRPRATGEPPPRRLQRGSGLLWIFGFVAIAVAVGSYPIVRRLTRRLERLRQGVEQWGEGDLSARVPVSGQDEVTFLAQRFNDAAERVQALLQSHKSLLANASHELRSPLTRIRMGLELMGTEAPTLVASRTALPPVGAVAPRGGPSSLSAFENTKQEISRNINELDQLIDEILLASRLDAKEADLGTVEAVDLIGMAAEECARVDAEFDLAGTGEVLASGVVKLLRRVVRNLLENARRYSSGEVHLTLSVDAGQAVIRVRDHGPGVPPAERERIFEPFYRMPGASEREGGVGLGLALVKTIVLRHRGSVHCEDNPGGGACFVVRLPLFKS
ncbi:MAG: ATP-binding protein [Burkholderiaceae bacterium]